MKASLLIGLIGLCLMSVVLKQQGGEWSGSSAPILLDKLQLILCLITTAYAVAFFFVLYRNIVTPDLLVKNLLPKSAVTWSLFQ